MATFLVAGMTSTVMAQNTVTTPSPVGAKIVSVLTLINQNGLNFGTISKPVGNAKVTVATDGNRTVDVAGAGSVKLMTADATVAASYYKLTGEAGYVYSITLPGQTDVTITSGLNSITVTDFTVKSINEAGLANKKGRLVGGNDEFKVGATLNLSNATVAGTYTGSFNVSVTYD